MSLVPGVLDSKVFIACIPCTVEDDRLVKTVEEFGNILQYFYCPDKKNSDAGFAFFTFANAPTAQRFVQLMDGQTPFQNSIRPLRVSLACRKLFDGDAFTETGHLVPSASWRDYKTDEGFVYYHNSETGETVWEKPPYFLNFCKPAEDRPSTLSKQGGNMFTDEIHETQAASFDGVASFQRFQDFTFVAFCDSAAAAAARLAHPGRFVSRPGEISV